MSSRWNTTASNKSGEGDYEIPPADNHPAVLVALVDLGTHEEEYQGDRYDARKVLFAWELTAEHKADGSPFVVCRDYRFSEKMSSKSKLREMLAAWRGKPLGDGEDIDLAILLGRPCMLNVGHETSKKGKTYAKVLSITPPPRGTNVPKPLSEPFEWHFGAGPFKAPDWLPFLYGRPVEDVIAEAKESRGAGLAPARPGGAGGEDASVPRSGKALFAWASEQQEKTEIGLVAYLNSWAKLQEFPNRMVDWDAEQVAMGHAEAVRKLRSVPTAAGAVGSDDADDDSDIPF